MLDKHPIEYLKPIQVAESSASMEEFIQHLKLTGYRFEPVGKPRTLLLAARYQAPDSLANLNPGHLRQIDQFLTKEDADGAILIDSSGVDDDSDSDSLDYGTITLVLYRLFPLTENSALSDQAPTSA
jgi:hypothetical protein